MSQLRITIIKLVICILAIMGLLMTFAYSAFPGASLFKMAYFSAIVIVAVLALGGVSVYITGEFKQWSLNNGATDTGWLWFSADPPGLEAIRNGVDVTTLSAKAKQASAPDQTA